MFSPSSASSIEPPQVVVVNPTPNLTPHPTPPATPLLQGTIGPGGVFKSQWLTLPEGAAGARQHQLLEAVYQQELLAPHYSPLHLPPSQVPGTSRVGGSSNSNIQRNLGEGFAAGNHATRPTTTALSNGASSNSANGDYQQQQQLHHFDRSRSVPMGTCDPETARTGVGADDVISKQVGFVVPKEVLGQHLHQSSHHQNHHQAPQMRQQGQAEFGAATAEYYPSRTGNNSASFTGVYGQQPQPQIQPQPPSTLEDSRGARPRSPSSTTSNRSRNSITSDQASSSKGDGSFSTTSTTSSLSSDNVKPDTFHTGREVHNNNNNIYGAADVVELHQQSSYSTMTQTWTTTSARRMGEDVIVGYGRAVSAKNRLPEEGVNNGTGVEADVERADRTSQLSHLPTHSQPSNSHSHSPNRALSASSSSQKQRAKKRNSAPVLPAITSTAAPTASTSSAAMLVLSPTLSTGSGKHSSYLASSPGSMTDHSSARANTNTNTKSKERKVHAVAAGGGLVRRTSSSGRSTSSLGKSRSRSREIGIGGGGLNMTAAIVAAVAAAVPPPTTRKAGGAARGRPTKVVFNRPGAKKGALRKNSAGTTSAAAAAAAATTAAPSSAQGNEDEDVDLDLDMVDGEVEEMVHKLEEQFERAKERTEELERQRILQIAEERRLVLNREADKLVAQEQDMRVAEEVRQMEERQRNALVLDEIIASGEEGAAATAAGKRAAHFNIGSNSDSGVGSKSVSPNLPCEPTTEHMHVPEGSPTSRNSNSKGKQMAMEEPLIKQAQQDLHEQEAIATATRMAEVQQQQQQQHYQQQQLQQNIPVQMQMERQLSKHQLAQLQAMERVHRQQHPTDLQRQQISRQQGQQKPLFSKRASSAQGSSVGSGSVEKREKSAKQKGKEKDVTIKVVKGSKSAIALDEKTVKQHIAAPLLPQKVRTIVVTSGSEFETDLEDDGSWSSEESTGDGKQQQKVEVNLFFLLSFSLLAGDLIVNPSLSFCYSRSDKRRMRSCARNSWSRGEQRNKLGLSKSFKGGIKFRNVNASINCSRCCFSSNRRMANNASSSTRPLVRLPSRERSPAIIQERIKVAEPSSPGLSCRSRPSWMCKPWNRLLLRLSGSERCSSSCRRRPSRIWQRRGQEALGTYRSSCTRIRKSSRPTIRIAVGLALVLLCLEA
ncbi:hypothetical protein CPC08DRAFT_373317 [Agrocybe pediades]|nr:hypothetical protein CPC08DRAFT_373317 [Agrocybe pediades]